MRLLFGLILFLLLSLMWFLGGHLVVAWNGAVQQAFGEVGNLENTFAPISALFAALASAGALYAIYAQGKQFKIQQFQSNFFSLLNIYKESKKDICVMQGGERLQPAECFERYVRELRIIYQSTTSQHPGLLCTGDEEVLKSAREYIDGYRNENGELDLSAERLFAVSYEAFVFVSQPNLRRYFHKLYQLIKYANSDSPFGQRPVYMGIIRTEFSRHEHVFIYYDVLMYEDKSSLFKRKRFKRLVEKNKLLHNIDRKILFDGKAAGEYCKSAYSSYAERAYELIAHRGYACVDVRKFCGKVQSVVLGLLTRLLKAAALSK